MKKILIAVTNCAKYEASERATGLWLGELVHFYIELRSPDITLDIASPRGGATPIDPASLSRMVTDGEVRAFQADATMMALLERTRPASELRADDYDAIYYTGGHGTMWDFPDEPHFQAIARNIYERGGWVAAVCHGVAGLIGVKLGNGDYLIKGKRLTGYSDREELFGGTRKIVPYSLEARLRERGANYVRATVPFVPHALADGRLLTGQNPFSTRALARLLRQRLNASSRT
jgi:putative intracellular protease/amidase